MSSEDMTVESAPGGWIYLWCHRAECESDYGQWAQDFPSGTYPEEIAAAAQQHRATHEGLK